MIKHYTKACNFYFGLISKKSAKIICKKSKFLALNAQVNASNIGYHTIRNYNNFDTLIINEKEIRHEMRDKVSKVENLMSFIAKEKNKSGRQQGGTTTTTP